MKEKQTASLVFFKHNSGKSYSFTLPIRRLQFIIFSVFFAFICLGFGIYLSYNDNIQQVAYTQLKKDYAHQDQTLKTLLKQVDSITDNMEALIEKEEALELLLGKAYVSKKKG